MKLTDDRTEKNGRNKFSSEALPQMKIFGFSIDIARQIEREECLVANIERLLDSGYNSCMLYVEDACQFASHPAIGREHAYSPEFMDRVFEACRRRGAELIPVIPSLGHCQYITSKPGYEKYDEGYGREQLFGTVVAGREETYSLLEELYRDWTDRIPGKYLHAGLDESPAMGQSFIREHGAENFDAPGMFAAHANRLNRIIRQLGRRMIMWGDMLYYFPAAADLLDKDIIIADWYYYHFKDTPKVEAFNFAPVDLTGELKAKGLEVWGIPSVWPNLPFPDIFDRYLNFRDWMRYGRERGIGGIINSDWENSFGFLPASELALTAFAEMRGGSDVDKLPRKLAEAFTAMTGIVPDEVFITDLLALGRHHITAHGNRSLLRPDRSMRSTAPARIREFETKAAELGQMFPALSGMFEECKLPQGQNLLETIRLCRDFLRLFWESAAAMSVPGTPLKYLSLADELDAFSAGYHSFRDLVRYPAGQALLPDWAAGQAAEFRKLAAGKQQPCALLELMLQCDRPALPVLKIEIVYADGTVREAQEVMINFSSEYAVPDKTWKQYPAIRLEKPEIPEMIRLASTHYGMVGVGEVKLTFDGQSVRFTAREFSGKYVRETDGILWLGPVGATPADPAHRLESDTAVYYPRKM
ncbi:MAG: family 20 glycosylhydrolase [Victivallaceae bacterium]|nr:family 20 glycosylhydrolase [Victivallaceae bacterium]